LDYKQTVTNKDVLDVIKQQKVDLDFKPNTRFNYSNTNYVVLASIVEEVTRKKFKNAVKDLVFAPLQMSHSFVFDDISKKDLVTQSYKSNNREMHWDYMDGTYGDKNIYTTPRDFLKLDTALYSDEFLSANLKEQMYQGYSFETKGKKNYGLGMRLIKMANGENYTFHNGWWRGNTSSYIRLAQDSICIILFSNKYSNLTYKTVDLSHHFGNYSVGNLDI
jgi:CubicO group peptidase (beta-lactamase class C family)